MFSTNLKLAKLIFDKRDFGKLRRILAELKQTCREEDANKNATQLLEVYALEIEMFSILRDTKPLRALYEKCLMLFNTAIPHPYVGCCLQGAGRCGVCLCACHAVPCCAVP